MIFFVVQVIDKDATPDNLVQVEVEFLDDTGAVTSNEALDMTNVNGTDYSGLWRWTPGEKKVYGISTVNGLFFC